MGRQVMATHAALEDLTYQFGKMPKQLQAVALGGHTALLKVVITDIRFSLINERFKPRKRLNFVLVKLLKSLEEILTPEAVKVKKLRDSTEK